MTEMERAAWMYAADLGETRATLLVLRETLAELATEAQAKLDDECADRQLIAEHLVDRLIVLAGGGR